MRYERDNMDDMNNVFNYRCTVLELEQGRYTAAVESFIRKLRVL